MIQSNLEFRSVANEELVMSHFILLHFFSFFAQQILGSCTCSRLVRSVSVSEKCLLSHFSYQIRRVCQRPVGATVNWYGYQLCGNGPITCSLYIFCRFGYHYTIMCIASWPLLIWLSMSKCHGHDRMAVESDIKDGLYSRAVYIIVMVSYLMRWL